MLSQAKGRARLLLVGAGVVVLVGAAACATTVDTRSQKEDDISAKELTARNGRHFHGPVAVVIDTVRAHADLSAEQAQHLALIEADLKADQESRKVLHDQLRNSAVAVVRAGTANSKEFDRSVSQAVDAIEEHMQKSADALEEIHDLLDADQRAQVAAALRVRIDEKLGKKPDEKRQREGFKRFANRLMLSTFQVEKLQAMKKELLGDKEQLRPSREELVALVDAFEGDDFGAALNSFHAKKSKILRSKVAQAGRRTDSVLTLLTPAQRDLLADLILEGPYKVLLGDKPAETAAN